MDALPCDLVVLSIDGGAESEPNPGGIAGIGSATGSPAPTLSGTPGWPMLFIGTVSMLTMAPESTNN